jgi:hypothetical protein
MFDRGDFVIGNVRIDCGFRWRRNGSRNGDACHRGNDGPHGHAGHINNVANVSSVGNVDHLRNGHLGNVGNVRLRLKQHCFIVDSNFSVAHHNGRWRSNGDSVGFYGDDQSRS